MYNRDMDEPVALKISSKDMHFETFGTMNQNEDCVAFAFDADAAHFVLSAYDGHLTVIRCGDESYEFDVNEGERTGFPIETPFGTLPVHIDGQRVKIKRGAAVELLVKYMLGVADEQTPVQLHIEAVPQGGLQ